jgi:hypothetical protein
VSGQAVLRHLEFPADLKAEKLVGIGVSDLGAISDADGALVEPCLRFTHVLVGIVDGMRVRLRRRIRLSTRQMP